MRRPRRLVGTRRAAAGKAMNCPRGFRSRVRAKCEDYQWRRVESYHPSGPRPTPAHLACDLNICHIHDKLAYCSAARSTRDKDARVMGIGQRAQISRSSGGRGPARYRRARNIPPP
ncbi:hypothetical protein EVAR_61686_1 [Eumeta japonica]|uniref:Uncharacterized protein n=1 Tax=Eumeta variegata TaxID=151549 RepID=A0A4C1ZWY3_EUMVA|nr:hypothetical protein EVAR_61686_1 [Eumeta japonica]